MGGAPRYFPLERSPNGGPPVWVPEMGVPHGGPSMGFAKRVPKMGVPNLGPQGLSPIVPQGRSRNGDTADGIPKGSPIGIPRRMSPSGSPTGVTKGGVPKL